MTSKYALSSLTKIFPVPFNPLSNALAGVTLFFAIAFVAHNSASAQTSPDGFIKGLSEQAIEALTGKTLSSAERNERFRHMLKDAFDIPRVSGFLLGPFRRKASDADFAEFQSALEENIVVTYAWRFSQYNGQQFDVSGVREGRRGAKIVQSVLSQADGGSPIAIDWTVTETDGNWRIFDIVIEGLSLVVTQRDEYVSVIRRNGGEISALVDALNKQTEAFRKRADS